jgi:hypothetical protein
MVRVFIATLILSAFLAETRLGNAAEIVTECPHINEQGQKLVKRQLLPDTLPMKRVGLRNREFPAPFSSTELDWLFWIKGMPPITDAAFSCIYEDKSEIYVPIVGMLLHCRTLMPAEPTPSYQWPILCTSETDPGLLLGK